MIQVRRGPGEKWIEYYPTVSTERIVLVREPGLMVLEKPYIEVVDLDGFTP
jgi:hypothetical protein